MIRGIILAGGSGTRFWPLSSPSKPKQLLPLIFKKTLLEQAISRLKPIVDSIHISTSLLLAPAIKSITDENLIIEPDKRDTAAAIGLCATQFAPEDVLIFISSDAHITPDKEFHKTIQQAIKHADSNIVVIGIPPTHPSTAYGYIETSPENKVVSFKEKPDEDTAIQYIQKNYLWNAGMFIVKVSTLLSLFENHAPSIHKNLMQIKQGEPLEKIYPLIEKISFDYAVMEKAQNVKYVPASFQWTDLGSFDSLADIIKDNNIILKGNLMEINSSRNIIHTEKTAALIDCSDLIIINTDDVLLVCPKKSSQKIKKLAEEYKNDKHNNHSI